MAGVRLSRSAGPRLSSERHRPSSRHGRYLSPEPLLQSPEFVRSMAENGYSTPTYAYALNNPVRHTDPTGLAVPLVLPLIAITVEELAMGGAVAFGAAGAGSVAGAASQLPPINWGGDEPGAGVPYPPSMPAPAIPQPASEPGCSVVPMGKRGGGGKGERGRTGSNTGTSNPWKHCRPDPTDVTKILCKDSNGHWKRKAKPEGFDDWWNNN